MIHWVTHAALRLDLWLQEKLGRPYHVLLGIGLITEIVRRLIEIPKRAASAPGLIGVALVVILEVALLINQVGALSHHVGRRRAKVEPAGEIDSHPAAESPKLNPTRRRRSRARR